MSVAVRLKMSRWRISKRGGRRAHTPLSVRSLATPDGFQWLQRVLLEWGIIVFLFLAMDKWDHPLAYAVGIFFVGSRQHALAGLGHDGLHFAGMRNRSWNDWLTCLLAYWPLGTNLDAFRKFHFAHHQHTGKAQDPELEHKSWAAAGWSLPMTRVQIARLFIGDLIGFGVPDILFLAKLWKPVSLRDLWGPPLFWLTAIAVSVLFKCWWVILVWATAMATSYWAIFHLRALAEHTGLQGTHRTRFSWWWEMIFVPHGIGYHFEHHRWPAIPCWNLSTARELDQHTPIVALTQVYRDFATAPAYYYGTPALPGLAAQEKSDATA